MSGLKVITDDGTVYDASTAAKNSTNVFPKSTVCNGGAGSDQMCIQAFNDPRACCMSMTLKNVPNPPESTEEKVLLLLAFGQFPIYENTEGHRCFTGKSRDLLQNQVKTSKYGQENMWHLLPEGDSLMYYKIYCDTAIKMVLGGLSMAAASLMISSF